MKLLSFLKLIGINMSSDRRKSCSDHDLEQAWAKLKDLNHFEHEDTILFLEFNPDPRSVPHLREAIELKPKLEYLDYDDYGAYYKKCLWALQEIGTPEAIEIIRESANSNIPELAEQARHRLKRIAESKSS